MHGDLLKRKVIIYKHIEHWDLVGDALTADDALKPKLAERA